MSAREAHPFVTIIAGPNGSGKSTLTQHLMARGVDFGLYINPDEIAAGLAGSYEDRVRQAQKIADERRVVAIRDRVSFSFETVMSHRGKLELLRQARDAGFLVQMFFVATVNPIINVDRVANRVLEGGHDVPVDKIIERYQRTMALLPEALLICHSATVFDNSGTSLVPWLTANQRQEDPVPDLRLAKHSAPTPEWIMNAVTQIELRIDAKIGETFDRARRSH